MRKRGREGKGERERDGERKRGREGKGETERETQGKGE